MSNRFKLYSGDIYKIDKKEITPHTGIPKCAIVKKDALLISVGLYYIEVKKLISPINKFRFYLYLRGNENAISPLKMAINYPCEQSNPYYVDDKSIVLQDPWTFDERKIYDEIIPAARKRK